MGPLVTREGRREFGLLLELEGRGGLCPLLELKREAGA